MCAGHVRHVQESKDRKQISSDYLRVLGPSGSVPDAGSTVLTIGTGVHIGSLESEKDDSLPLNDESNKTAAARENPTLGVAIGRLCEFLGESAVTWEESTAD